MPGSTQDMEAASAHLSSRKEGRRALPRLGPGGHHPTRSSFSFTESQYVRKGIQGASASCEAQDTRAGSRAAVMPRDIIAETPDSESR